MNFDTTYFLLIYELFVFWVTVGLYSFKLKSKQRKYLLKNITIQLLYLSPLLITIVSTDFNVFYFLLVDFIIIHWLILTFTFIFKLFYEQVRNKVGNQNNI